jgi:polyisoprenoid-binding protein YceI
MPFTRPRHWLRWLIGAIVVLVVLGVGGPFVYIHFFNGSTPAALSLPTASSSASSPAGSATGGSATGGSATGGSATGGTATASTAATGSLAGTYRVGSGSVVGYRVNEVLVGQSTTAVGRTSSVTGHLTIAGTTATAASFSVPMDTVLSDKSQRNAEFDGRIMDVAQYPTGTFTLTSPIDLAPLPAVGVIKSYTATGKLTLHGATRTVTFSLTAERTAKDGGTQIEVVGHIPVLFSDYNIQNPSIGGFVTTQNNGLLEFLLVFSKA